MNLFALNGSGAWVANLKCPCGSDELFIVLTVENLSSALTYLIDDDKTPFLVFPMVVAVMLNAVLNG